MRAVLDTNVLVSAILSRGSPPDTVLRAWRQGAFQFVTSPTLLSELYAVLRRPRIRDRLGWTEEEIVGFVTTLAETAVVVEPEEELSVVRDEADNRVIEAAVAGEVDYVVTGDTDLLRLGSFEGVQIVTPARFAAILATARP
ncbi:MAG TPA: putative toxin-antitoxin system toxin component, PIN family [Dehalococcoidia bacterium]|nr:putative toxin-antitoxin system toxin component, PIN family [Dehalococcoidia bacterium]